MHQSMFVVPSIFLLFSAFVGCERTNMGSRDRDQEMKALNCTFVKLEEFEAAIAEVKTRSVYKPARGKTIQPVNFKIIFPDVRLSEERETLMVIFSNSVQLPVFIGPYTEQFSVAADESLLQQHGADTIRFEYYRKSKNQICFWEQDSTEPFWQANATSTISFLQGRSIDDRTGRAIAYNVKIEMKR
jgi:hypothetical protein